MAAALVRPLLQLRLGDERDDDMRSIIEKQNRKTGGVRKEVSSSKSAATTTAAIPRYALGVLESVRWWRYWWRSLIVNRVAK
jgi:hypothetical protein